METQREILTAFKQKKISIDQAREQIGQTLGQTPLDPEKPPVNGPVPVSTDRPASGAASRQEAPGDFKFEPMAVIGMAGRFPGADDIHALWKNLEQGRDSIIPIPKERWDMDLYYDPEPGKKGKICTRYAGFVNRIDAFDPAFFKVSKREACQMDPQYRLFLEEAWKALEDAAIPPGSLAGRKIGLFIGGGQGDYPGESIHFPSTEAGRLAYLHDWKGPCILVETTCSSALTALHEACLHMATGRLEMAVVGGVTLMTTPRAYLDFSRFSVLSPRGRCFSFDSRADGTIFSESVCAVVVKPLSVAQRDHDPIYGVIQGMGVNHDGRTNGLTSPGGQAQTGLITEVYERFGISPEEITLVEAHGTGTKLGDPVEVNALIKAFRKFTPGKHFCTLGSVKANIGHAGAAAGLVGLIKVFLAMKYKKIPPSINFQELNPAIHLGESPFVIRTELVDWISDKPRMAAVSSFGFSGTNAHVVVGEYTPGPVPGRIQVQETEKAAIVLSAKNRARLLDHARNLCDFLKAECRLAGGRNGSALCLADVAYTLQAGREPMEERMAFMAASLQDLVQILERIGKGSQDPEKKIPGVFTGRVDNPAHAAMAFAAEAKAVQTLEGHLDARNIEAVLACWIRGANIAWDRLYSEPMPCRVRLTSYPFARESYWVDTPETGKPEEGGDAVVKKGGATATPLAKPLKRLADISGNSPSSAPLAPSGQDKYGRILLSPLEGHASCSQPARPKDPLPRKLEPLAPCGTPARETDTPPKPPETGPGPNQGPDLMPALLESLAKALFMAPEELDISLPFIDMGMDSIISVEWIGQINREYSLNIPATKVYDHPNLKTFAIFLEKVIQTREKRMAGPAVPAPVRTEKPKELPPPAAKLSSIKLSSISNPSPIPRSSVPPLAMDDEKQRSDDEKHKPDNEKYRSDDEKYASGFQGKSGDRPGPVAAVRQRLLHTLCQALFIAPEDLDISLPFIDLGMDSIISVEWIGKINHEFHLNIAATKVYDHPDFERFARYVEGLLEERPRAARYSDPGLPTTKDERMSGLPALSYKPPRADRDWGSQACPQQSLKECQVRPLFLIKAEERGFHPAAKKETAPKVQEKRSPGPARSDVAAPVPGKKSFEKASGLGNPLFQERYNCRLSYFAGSMYRAIASEEMVAAMAGEGILSFFGSAGFRAKELEGRISSLQARVGKGLPFGMCLIANLNDPEEELAHARLLIRHRIPVIEAAAFSSMTRALVLCRVSGIAREGESILFPRRIIAKCSRLEVARQFLSPPPGEILAELVRSGEISDKEADLAKHIPMADDIAVEADSGGHTDQGVSFSLVPAMMGLRDEVVRAHAYDQPVMVGCGGGIGTPSAAAAAFALGADFIFTGSINQCTRESGAHPVVKDLLATLGVHDTTLAPAGDMFEIGARARVVSRGTHFARRANMLYDLFQQYSSLEAIPAPQIRKIEKECFKQSVQAIWEAVKAHKKGRRPEEIAEARNNPRVKMKLVFQWFFAHTSRVTLEGDVSEKDNFQIHCGPALGAFNAWVAGTSFASWKNRGVVEITKSLTDQAWDLFASRARTLAEKPGPADKAESSEPGAVPSRAPALLKSSPEKSFDIAIIGMAGRFPMAPDLGAFWDNLARGKSSIVEIPADRWDARAFYTPGKPGPGRTNCRWMGALDGVAAFDPLFFNISPAEAEWMDPQQRIFLETAWHCMEDSGYGPGDLSGAGCGVFAGCGGGEYDKLVYQSGLNARGLTGTSHAVLPARLAYTLNLKGPCMAIDTACSSSLVAVAQACDQLAAGTCDLAFAGGVSVLAGPALHIMAGQSGMLSPTGRCHTFDRRADGFVPGEGAGMLLLKRLSDAVQDRDLVRGVIKGWGVNQDGATNGLTAPSATSQAGLLTSVYQRFGIDPGLVTLVEAHGTATALGDPVEVAALTEAFQSFTDKREYCALGSVKSNIGHLLAAAGVSGLIKVMLALEKRQLPPTIHFNTLNPHIRMDESPFFINTTLKPWESVPGHPRMAAVSAFGFSGTNAHLVVEEAPPLSSSELSPAQREETCLFVLSAKTREGLAQSARNLLRFARTSSGNARPEEVAFTLQQGRRAMEHRAAFLAQGFGELAGKLEAFIEAMAHESFDLPECFMGVAGKKGAQPGPGLMAFSGDLAPVARHWVMGGDMDWKSLYGEDPPCRARLPLYPFARQSYWVPAREAAERSAVEPDAHPQALSAASDLSADPDQEERPPAREVIRAVETVNKKIQGPVLDILTATLVTVGQVARLGTAPYDTALYDSAFKITETYRPWVAATWDLLQENGRITREKEGLAVADRKVPDLDAAWAAWEALKEKSPEDAALQAQMALLEPCLRNLPQILSGEKQATAVIFPGASLELVEKVYTGNPASDYFNRILADQVVAFIQERLEKDPEARIRILEVGAGSGGATRGILEQLRLHAGQVENYLYTDLSTTFLRKADERFKTACDFLSFQAFDIEKPARPQGIGPGSQDLVIAANVLHAVKNIEAVLDHILPVLKPGGMLLANEISDHSVFAHATFGLLKGWWLWEDRSLRIPGCPGLFPETWERLLLKKGAQSVSFPAEEAHAAGQQVIVARMGRQVRGDYRPVSKETLEASSQAPLALSPERLESSPEPSTPSPEPFSPEPCEPVPGTSAQALKARSTVLSALCRTLKVDAAAIDGETSFSDYGVDSIAAVGIIDEINAALNLELDPTLLFDYNCLDSLCHHIAGILPNLEIPGDDPKRPGRTP